MRKIFIILLVFAILIACRFSFDKKIKGNGVFTTEQRKSSNTKKIKIIGNFDVQVSQSTSPSVEVSADANLMDYILTYDDDGWLKIKEKDGFDIKSSSPIKILVNTTLLENLEIVGSGNIKGMNKLAGSEKLEIKIAGSGDISLSVNTPKIIAGIAGNGDISIDGETKDLKVSIAGTGDFKGENLKSENASVHISGSGDVHVFASNTLDIHIAGSGDVTYSGTPQLTQHIAGSGTIKQKQ